MEAGGVATVVVSLAAVAGVGWALADDGSWRRPKGEGPKSTKKVEEEGQDRGGEEAPEDRERALGRCGAGAVRAPASDDGGHDDDGDDDDGDRGED